MKKFTSILLLCCLLLTLIGCNSFSAVNLQDPIAIPEDGIVKQEILEQIRDENAIGTFYGTAQDYEYEWTIFGSDLADVHDVNLALEFAPNQDEESVAFSLMQEGKLGFPAVLSIHLREKWNALSATVYQQQDAELIPVCSASVTGNKDTLLNFSVQHSASQYVILPDATVAAAEATPAPGSEAKPDSTAEPQNTVKADAYLSPVNGSNPSNAAGGGDRVVSDGSATEQDSYLTDPVPAGKPMPVEPENQTVNQQKTYTCTFSIECSTILNNLSDLDPDKLEMVPSDGVILPAQTVTFYEGESVFDVLQRVCKENGIPMESSWTPIYNSAYVEGIHNLYEFDCGQESGWMYRVNGWYPNYGCSRYQLTPGEVVEWRYTCKGLGNDVGCDWMG